jgi:hypothetical protein
MEGDDDGKLALRLLTSGQLWKQLKELSDFDEVPSSAVDHHTNSSGTTCTQVVRDAPPGHAAPDRVEGSTPSKIEIDHNRTSSNAVEHDNPDERRPTEFDSPLASITRPRGS